MSARQYKITHRRDGDCCPSTRKKYKPTRNRHFRRDGKQDLKRAECQEQGREERELTDLMKSGDVDPAYLDA